MGSRERAIEAAMADGIPIHKGYVAEVLDRAEDAHQVHYADQCPGNRGQRKAMRDLRAAKRQADENCIALVAERDALRERLEALEEIRQRVADGWWAERAAGLWWFTLADEAPEPMSPAAAAVLWPTTEEKPS